MRSQAGDAGLNNAIIFNTCAVTAEAERQARQAIRRARRENPDARIVVTGCAAQMNSYLATNLAGLTGPHFDRRYRPARLADEERPVRALVVLPPRHMTAALRHRQSRSARLRGQLRPSDDRLVFSDRWARSLSGPSPACRSPVRLAARGPLACSPPPPRVPEVLLIQNL